MHPSNLQHFKIILALMPLLSRGTSFWKTATTGIAVALMVLGATSLFTLVAPLFPKKLTRLSFFLFIAALYQSLHYFVSVPAVCLVSFFLLFDWNDVDRNRLGNKTFSLVPRLTLFAALILVLGLLQMLFSEKLGAAAWNQPARILILLSAAALLLQRFFPLRASRKAS